MCVGKAFYCDFCAIVYVCIHIVYVCIPYSALKKTLSPRVWDPKESSFLVFEAVVIASKISKVTV